jgi:hypothetical protein
MGRLGGIARWDYGYQAMKYKHDKMLPVHAFQRRGSVIGGRGMRLHGDSDDWWSQPEESPQDGYYQGNGDSGGNWMPTPAADPITQPAPAPLDPVAAPLSPAAPAYTPLAEDEFGFGTDEASSYANAARLANWHMSRGDPHGYAQQFIDQANELKGLLGSPYYIGTQTTGGGGDAGTNTESVFVTPEGNYSVVQDESGQYVANIIGSSGGESGGSNYTGAVIDIPALIDQQESANKRAFGTGFGQNVGYEYGLKNSEGNLFQKYDAQGNLIEYLDRDGVWQKASDVKPIGTKFNPLTGELDTVYSYSSANYGENPYITGQYVPGMSKFHEDQGGFLGEGGWSRMAGLVAAGLTAGVAGGAFAGAGIGGAGAAVPGSAAAIGTAATKGALTSLAVSGLQGASPQEMLKSGVVGAVSAGVGNAIGGAGLGPVGSKVARVGLQSGLAAISGGNVGQAAVSAIINTVLPDIVKEVMPADVSGALSELPEPIRKVVMSTAGSVLSAGFNGQDINNAAVNGVTNGLVSIGKDFASGAFKGLTDSELAQTIKGYFNPSSTAGDFTGEYDDIAPYDPDVALDDVINNLPVTTPPLVQDTINRNTPQTAETVTTPPLIETAMNQVDPDEVYRELVASYENPYSAPSLGTLASATTSDVDPVTLPTTTVRADLGEEEPTEGRFSVDDQALSLFNEILQEEGRPDLMAESLSDPRLLDFVNRANERIDSSSGLPSGLYSLGTGEVRPVSGATVGDSPLQSPLDIQSVVADMVKKAEFSDVSALLDVSKNPVVADALYSEGMRKGATPEQAQALVDAFLRDPNSVNAIRQEVMRILPVEPVEPAQPVPPPLVQDAINRTVEQAEQPKPEKVEQEKTTEKDTKRGGSGTQGGSLAGDQGRVGAAAPLATATDANVDAAAALSTMSSPQESVAIEAESVASDLASLGEIDPADIPIVMERLTKNSGILQVTPTVAISTLLVNTDGTLSDKGINKIAENTGLSPVEVENAVRGSSTIEAGTGSGLKGEGAGAAKGTGTGVSGEDGLGGRYGDGVGGQGTGVGTGVGAGEGTGRGGGGGSPSSGGSYGGALLTLNPQFPGALPGALEGTYLKGIKVDDYDPFESYKLYQQPEPIRAAQGGSPLQLMQLQQGIVGYDPSSYRNIQARPTPNYFTYGSDPSGGAPTTFAGSQLMGKPRPTIPVTPTGKTGSSDWLYQSAGSNQLSPAGAGLAPLASGMMAEGGQAEQNDQEEHIPEFITGATGHYVRGRGDGQSDDIPAMLADGEYVFDSSAVSTLGNGSSDAGAKLLDAFRETLREHTRSAPKDKIPPKASPLQYMQEAMKKVGMA